MNVVPQFCEVNCNDYYTILFLLLTIIFIVWLYTIPTTKVTHTMQTKTVVFVWVFVFVIIILLLLIASGVANTVFAKLIRRNIEQNRSQTSETDLTNLSQQSQQQFQQSQQSQQKYSSSQQSQQSQQQYSSSQQSQQSQQERKQDIPEDIENKLSKYYNRKRFPVERILTEIVLEVNMSVESADKNTQDIVKMQYSFGHLCYLYINIFKRYNNIIDELKNKNFANLFSESGVKSITILVELFFNLMIEDMQQLPEYSNFLVTMTGEFPTVIAKVMLYNYCRHRHKQKPTQCEQFINSETPDKYYWPRNEPTEPPKNVEEYRAFIDDFFSEQIVLIAQLYELRGKF